MSKLVGLVDNVYVFGNAEISVGIGKTKDVKQPFISIAKMQYPASKIAEDIVDKNIPENKKIILLFKNIQGLEVLEKMIKECKKELKLQAKLL